MKTLNVFFTASNEELNTTFTKEFDVTDNTDLDDILNEILSENDIEDSEGWELLDEVTSDEDIHKNYLNTNDIFEYAEAYNDSSYELEVINAAIDCDVNLSDIDEAYNGSYKDDEDFAESMADELGYTNKEVSWPYTCIDWGYAAKELMYDYSTSNGHYFRSL